VIVKYASQTLKALVLLSDSLQPKSKAVLRFFQNKMQLRLSTVAEQMEMAVGFNKGWLSLS